MKLLTGSLGVVSVLAGLLIGASLASAKLPPGSTFEACGASGCKVADPEDVLGLHLRLLEPTIDHGGRKAPATDHTWVRVDLKLGAPLPGMSLGSVKRSFPVVYAADAALVGVPRGNDTYRWRSLNSNQSAAYARVASAVSPFAPESLASLTPSAVVRADPGSTTNRAGDAKGLPLWPLAVAAALAGLIVAGRLKRSSRRQQLA